MDPYEQIAAEYDLEHDDFRDDVVFLRNVLPEGRILEVGAGSGRLTAPLARAGLEVWAIDRSEAMLRRARGRLKGEGNVHFVLSSILDLQLDLQFDACVFSLNALWHLTTFDSQLEALRVARRHLIEGGRLVVDLSNPFALADRSGDAVRQRFRRRCGDGSIAGFSSVRDDEAEQILHMDVWYDLVDGSGAVTRREAALELRYLYRFELEGMLRLAHFATNHVYGSYDLEPYAADSPNLIVEAVACPGSYGPIATSMARRSSGVSE